MNETFRCKFCDFAGEGNPSKCWNCGIDFNTKPIEVEEDYTYTCHDGEVITKKINVKKVPCPLCGEIVDLDKGYSHLIHVHSGIPTRRHYCGLSDIAYTTYAKVNPTTDRRAEG